MAVDAALLSLLDRCAASAWKTSDQEAIRQALALPATVPCLDAIGLAMADLERQHPGGVLSARALLDAVALIDQQLLAGGAQQEQAIHKTSRSGPIAGSVAAAGDAPLQKADVIAYDTALLREESETVYAAPGSPAVAMQKQRQPRPSITEQLGGHPAAFLDTLPPGSAERQQRRRLLGQHLQERRMERR